MDTSALGQPGQIVGEARENLESDIRGMVSAKFSMQATYVAKVNKVDIEIQQPLRLETSRIYRFKFPQQGMFSKSEVIVKVEGEADVEGTIEDGRHPKALLHSLAIRPKHKVQILIKQTGDRDHPDWGVLCELDAERLYAAMHREMDRTFDPELFEEVWEVVAGDKGWSFLVCYEEGDRLATPDSKATRKRGDADL